MELQVKKIFEELLVRGDGKGGIKGMHIVFIEEKSFEGEVISVKLGEPEPVAMVDGENGYALKTVLGEALASALVSTEAIGNTLGEVSSANTELRATVKDQTEKLTQAYAAFEVYQAEIKAKDTRIAELETKLSTV